MAKEKRKAPQARLERGKALSTATHKAMLAFRGLERRLAAAENLNLPQSLDEIKELNRRSREGASRPKYPKTPTGSD